MTDAVSETNSQGGLSPAPNPGFHAISGDYHDDDGQVLDDMFAPAFTGPVASESYSLGYEETPKTTRILSRSLPTDPDNPVQVYPADVRRLHIRIVANVDVRIASDKTDLNGAAVLPATTTWTNDYHTGAIWVCGDVAAAVVNVWVITD